MLHLFKFVLYQWFGGEICPQMKSGCKINIARYHLTLRYMGPEKKFIHGTTRLEAKLKERERICEKVLDIHKHPPKLDRWHPKITKIPLPERLKRSTNHLQHWLDRVSNQVKLTKQITELWMSRQLTLKQTYANQHIDLTVSTKYPPWWLFHRDF